MPQLQDNPNSLPDIAKGVWASQWIQQLKGQVNGLYTRVNGLSSGSTSTPTLQQVTDQGAVTTNGITVDSIITGAIQLQDGSEANTYVLTSDVDGNGTWAPIPAGTTPGIDSVLGQMQDFTVNRSINAANNEFEIKGASILTLNSANIKLASIPSSPTAATIYNRPIITIADNYLAEDTEYYTKITATNTTDATVTAVLTLPIATYLPSNGDTLRIRAELFCRSAGNRAEFVFYGMAINTTGTISIVGTSVTPVAIKSGGYNPVGITLTTDATTNVFVNVTGFIATNISWNGEVYFRLN